MSEIVSKVGRGATKLLVKKSNNNNSFPRIFLAVFYYVASHTKYKYEEKCKYIKAIENGISDSRLWQPSMFSGHYE